VVMCEALKKWIADQPKERRHKWLSEQVGVSLGMIYRYCDGTRKPGDPAMGNLAKATNYAVTANDFYGIDPSKAKPVDVGRAA